MSGPRAKILLLAGDMGYGRSLKTLALSVRSIVCVSRLVVPRIYRVHQVFLSPFT